MEDPRFGGRDDGRLRAPHTAPNVPLFAAGTHTHNVTMDCALLCRRIRNGEFQMFTTAAAIAVL